MEYDEPRRHPLGNQPITAYVDRYVPGDTHETRVQFTVVIDSDQRVVSVGQESAPLHFPEGSYAEYEAYFNQYEA